MSFLGPSRDEIRRLIGAPCLVRTDRKRRALFLCDFPRRLPKGRIPDVLARLQAAGYEVRLEGSLALLDWSPGRYAGFLRSLDSPSLPPLRGADPWLWGLCRLLRQHPVPPEQQPKASLRDALILLEAGQPALLAGLASRDLALSLRRASPVASGVADLMIAAGVLDAPGARPGPPRKEDNPC